MNPQDKPKVGRMSRDCPNCGTSPYGATAVELKQPSGKTITAVTCYRCGTVYRP